MDEDALFTAELGSSKRVAVRNYKNIKLIDIREFYEKNGEKLPGRKGISLTSAQFQALLEQADEVKRILGIDDKEKDNSDEEKMEPKRRSREELPENEGGFVKEEIPDTKRRKEELETKE